MNKRKRKSIKRMPFHNWPHFLFSFFSTAIGRRFNLVQFLMCFLLLQNQPDRMFNEEHSQFMIIITVIYIRIFNEYIGQTVQLKCFIGAMEIMQNILLQVNKLTA